MSRTEVVKHDAPKCVLLNC